VERVRTLLPGEDCKIAFLRDKLRLFDEMLALLLERGTPVALAEAFAVAERSKSRTLLELLAGPAYRRASASPEGRRLLQRLEELHAQLNWDYHRLQGMEGETLPPPDAALPARVRDLEMEYRRTRRELQLLAAEVGFPEESSVPSLEELQSTLDEEQLLEYVTVGDEVAAFVVSREGFHTQRHLASRAAVEHLLERLRYQWSKLRLGRGYIERHRLHLEAATGQILRGLYDMLLRPLERHLPATCLTVVPHGILHSIPFHALADGTAHALDRWEIACAPSAAVWQACRRRPEPRADGSLIVGVAEPRTPPSWRTQRPRWRRSRPTRRFATSISPPMPASARTTPAFPACGSPTGGWWPVISRVAVWNARWPRSRPAGPV